MATTGWKIAFLACLLGATSSFLLPWSDSELAVPPSATIPEGSLGTTEDSSNGQPADPEPELAGPPGPNEAVADEEARGSSHRLRNQLDRILPDHRFPGSDWALVAVSLAKGDTLYSRNADLPLAPASNAKLLTSAAALHYLGPDFRFPTFLLADGPVEDGVLRGDLILYGTGDPTISDRFHPSRTRVFEELAAALQARGVHRIEGRVIGDGSFFSQTGVPESWDPANFSNSYSAPASALAFNENVVTLRVAPGGGPGEPARIRTLPEGAKVDVHNEASTVTGRAWPPLSVERRSFDEPIRVSGQLSPGAQESWRVIPVGEPALYTASVFRNVLLQAGIVVDGQAQGIQDAHTSRVTNGSGTIRAPRFQDHSSGPELLAIHRSPPLQDLLEVVNKRSNNFYSEVILLALGRLVRDHGSFDGGTAALRGFLAGRVGLDTSRMHIYDGSGLSRENRITARDLVALLSYMAESPLEEAFWQTLPEAGSPRELNRMHRTAAAGNLRAKTGTIRNVSALSGIVHSVDGEPILFSIIGNGVSSPWAFKRVEDQIGEELARFYRPAPEIVTE